MNFRLEYAENILQKLAYDVRKKLTEERSIDFHWETNIHVSGFWHFNIRYKLNNSMEIIEIVHQKRHGHMIIVENGKIVKHAGIKRFDMFFAALNEDLMLRLKNGCTFKITRKKLNERFLMKTPYFWSKIEYYLQKKEIQKVLFEMFRDPKYKIRENRIEKAIQFYMKEKREFVENTKKMILV